MKFVYNISMKKFLLVFVIAFMSFTGSLGCYFIVNPNSSLPTFSEQDEIKSSASGSWENVVKDENVNFESGNGTEETPFIIKTASQLAKLSFLVKNGEKFLQSVEVENADAQIEIVEREVYFYDCFYKLSSDIDLSEHYWTPIGGQILYTSHFPQLNFFKGSFDGANHVVSGMTVEVTRSSTYSIYGGLFGKVVGGQIKNLTVNGSIKIFGFGGNVQCVVGGVVGELDSVYGLDNIECNVDISSQLENNYTECYELYVGGVVGLIKKTANLLNVRYDGNIQYKLFNDVNGSVLNFGGIVGQIKDWNEIKIVNCYTYGGLNISSGPIDRRIRKIYVGGTIGSIVGDCENVQLGEIVYCINSATIEFLGSLEFIDKTSASGGIVGKIDCTDDVNSQDLRLKIYGCHNYGYFKIIEMRNLSVGGIVGYNNLRTEISGCSNFGTIDFETVHESSFVDSIGGIIGYGKSQRIEDCVNYGPLNDVTSKVMITSIKYISNVGGIAGSILDSVVNRCLNYRLIFVKVARYASGIVACSNNSYVYNCVNIGEIKIGTIITMSGGQTVLIAQIVSINTSGKIKNCYGNSNYSSISICKMNSGTITNSDLKQNTILLNSNKNNTIFSLDIWNVNSTEENNGFSNLVGFNNLLDESDDLNDENAIWACSNLPFAYTFRGSSTSQKTFFLKNSVGKFNYEVYAVQDNGTEQKVEAQNYSSSFNIQVINQTEKNDAYLYLRGADYSNDYKLALNLFAVEILNKDNFVFDDSLTLTSKFSAFNVFGNFQEKQFGYNITTAGEVKLSVLFNHSHYYFVEQQTFSTLTLRLKFRGQNKNINVVYHLLDNEGNEYQNISTDGEKSDVGTLNAGGDSTSSFEENYFTYVNFVVTPLFGQALVGIKVSEDANYYIYDNQIKNINNVKFGIVKDKILISSVSLHVYFKELRYNGKFYFDGKSFDGAGIEGFNSFVRGNSISLLKNFEINEEFQVGSILEVGVNLDNSNNFVPVNVVFELEVDKYKQLFGSWNEDNGPYKLSYNEVVEKVRENLKNQNEDIVNKWLSSDSINLGFERREASLNLSVSDYSNSLENLDIYELGDRGGVTSFLNEKHTFNDLIVSPNRGYFSDIFKVINFIGETETVDATGADGQLKYEDVMSKYVNIKTKEEYNRLNQQIDEIIPIDLKSHYSLAKYQLNGSFGKVVDGSDNDNFNVDVKVKMQANGSVQDIQFANGEIYSFAPISLSANFSGNCIFAGYYLKDENGNNKLLSTNKEFSFDYALENLKKPSNYNKMPVLTIEAKFVGFSSQESAPELVRGVYTISNASHLLWISNQVASGNSFEGNIFNQTKNIDLENVRFRAIGDSLHPFKGVYNGNHYTISELNLLAGEQNNFSNMGLFGYTENAIIKNITLNGGNVEGYKNVGAIVGSAKNTVFENIKNNNCQINSKSIYFFDVYGFEIVESEENDYSAIGLLVRENFAGLVGFAENCKFVGCFNNASINDGAFPANLSNVAGLVGNSKNSTFKESFNISIVNGSHNFANVYGSELENCVENCYFKNGNEYTYLKGDGWDENVWVLVNGTWTLARFYW